MGSSLLVWVRSQGVLGPALDHLLRSLLRRRLVPRLGARLPLRTVPSESRRFVVRLLGPVLRPVLPIRASGSARLTLSPAFFKN